MTTYQFIKEHITETTYITIADIRGNILFEGKAKNTPQSIINNTTISKIDGLGTHNDLIILVKEDI